MRLLSEAEKKKFPVVSIIRKIVQVISFILINYMIFEIIFNIDLSLITDLSLPYPFLQTPRSYLFDGKGGAGLIENIMYSIGHGTIPFFLIGVLMLISLVLGRFTCGWMCPVGLFQDILYIFQKKSRRRKMPINIDLAMKQVKRWVLGILLVIMIFFFGVYNINLVQYQNWRDSIGTFIQRPVAGFSLSEFLFYTLPQMIQTGVEEGSFTAMFPNGSGWGIFQSDSCFFELIAYLIGKLPLLGLTQISADGYQNFNQLFIFDRWPGWLLESKTENPG